MGACQQGLAIDKDKGKVLVWLARVAEAKSLVFNKRNDLQAQWQSYEAGGSRPQSFVRSICA